MTLLTVTQVAEMYQIKESTVRTWIRTGRLPSVNIGTERRPIYRIPREFLPQSQMKLSCSPKARFSKKHF